MSHLSNLSCAESSHCFCTTNMVCCRCGIPKDDDFSDAVIRAGYQAQADALAPEPACWWCKQPVSIKGPFLSNEEQTIRMCGPCAQDVADFLIPNGRERAAVAQARAEQREQEEQGQRGLVMALQELYDVTTYLQGVLTFTQVDLLKPEMELASLWLIRVRSDLRRALIPQGKLTHTEASQLNLPSLNDLRSGWWCKQPVSGGDDPMSQPDFDQIAKKVLSDQGVYEDYLGQLHIANALKEIWNARGAADLAAIDDVAHTNDKAVANAIRSLDAKSSS